MLSQITFVLCAITISSTLANVIVVSDEDSEATVNAFQTLSGQGGGGGRRGNRRRQCAAAQDVRTLLTALAGTVAGQGVNAVQSLVNGQSADGGANSQAADLGGDQPTALEQTINQSQGRSNQDRLVSAIQDMVNRNSRNQGLLPRQVRALNRLSRNGVLSQMLIEAMVANQQRAQQLQATQTSDSRSGVSSGRAAVDTGSAQPDNPPASFNQQSSDSELVAPPATPNPQPIQMQMASPCCNMKMSPTPDPIISLPQRKTHIVGFLINPSFVSQQQQPLGGPLSIPGLSGTSALSFLG
ncbi:hypothetical protein HDE_09865 [Halotydeus destructor]|nr:hypothetical protein HDE_09865 [Halotydeus destructor]